MVAALSAEAILPLPAVAAAHSAAVAVAVAHSAAEAMVVAVVAVAPSAAVVAVAVADTVDADNPATLGILELLGILVRLEPLGKLAPRTSNKKIKTTRILNSFKKERRLFQEKDK